MYASLSVEKKIIRTTLSCLSNKDDTNIFDSKNYTMARKSEILKHFDLQHCISLNICIEKM